MPWARTDVGEQRVKFVVRAASGKERMAALCREFGISRTTGYRWRRRFEHGKSLTAVVEHSRRPKHSPWQTAPRKEELVVELRRERGWGAKKLDILLREKKSALTITTINRILKRRGLVGMKDSHPPALQRFERAAPNELWQMDGKGEYRASDGTCYPLSILDDHSRYAVGLYSLPAFTAELVHPCLVNAFERCGVPEAMLMDHGSVWWGTTNGYGLTWLSVRLIEQGIRLCYGRVRHPQTQGKVEREGQTWFVCEALAGRWVRVESVENLLAVSYRHMYVREIDRKQGCTKALVMSRDVDRALRSPFGLPTSPVHIANQESGV